MKKFCVFVARNILERTHSCLSVNFHIVRATTRTGNLGNITGYQRIQGESSKQGTSGNSGKIREFREHSGNFIFNQGKSGGNASMSDKSGKIREVFVFPIVLFHSHSHMC